MKVEDIKNWESFSEETKNNINLAIKERLDSLGLVMTGKYNPTESVAIMQSLADPKFIGESHNASYWNNINFSKVNKIADSVDTYNNNGYSSYSLISKPDKIGLTLPLLLNYTTNGKINAESLTKFEKLIELFEGYTGKSIEIDNYSNSDEFYKESKKELVIFKKVNNLELNEFEQIVLLANIVAKQITEANEKSFKNDRKEFKSKTLDVIDEITTLATTIGIVRTINFDDPEMAHKVDEALKLQFSNALASIETTSNKHTDLISKQVKGCVDSFETIAKFPISKIKQNMKAIGFEYDKDPISYSEAVFNVNNLNKIFGLNAKMAHIFGSAAVRSWNSLRFEKWLPGYVEFAILTKSQKGKILRGEIAGEENARHIGRKQNLMYFIKNSNDKELYHSVRDKYEEWEENFFNKALEEAYKSQPKNEREFKALLKDLLNAEYNADEEKKKYAGTLLRKIIRNMVKDAKKESKSKKTTIEM